MVVRPPVPTHAEAFHSVTACCVLRGVLGQKVKHTDLVAVIGQLPLRGQSLFENHEKQFKRDDFMWEDERESHLAAVNGCFSVAYLLSESHHGEGRCQPPLKLHVDNLHQQTDKQEKQSHGLLTADMFTYLLVVSESCVLLV